MSMQAVRQTIQWEKPKTKSMKVVVQNIMHKRISRQQNLEHNDLNKLEKGGTLGTCRKSSPGKSTRQLLWQVRAEKQEVYSMY